MDQLSQADHKRLLEFVRDCYATRDFEPLESFPGKFIVALSRLGVAQGTSATRYSPWSPLSRAQLITMTVRTIQALEPGRLHEVPAGYVGSLGDFSTVHGPAMRIAEYNGLLSGLAGFGSGWNPWNIATRGEIAQVIDNLINF